MRHKLICFILASFLLGVVYTDSIIMKTHDFNLEGFDSLPSGLTYPEYIYPRIQQNYMRFDVFNMTSEKLVFSTANFSKGVFNNCDSAMQKIDYGYYTKFPFYRIIVECSNQTHTQIFNVKIYRSWDSEVKPGAITAKSVQQQNCTPGPLKVQYFYSASGSPSTFVYRFCTKKNSTSQSIYKEYIMDATSAYIFKEDSVQRVTGLTNISIVDMQPAIGIDGKFNVYLSENYGVIVNGGSKFLQTIWAIPGQEKPFKIEKMCWGNNFAVLTDGYIYFIGITIYTNQTVAVNLLRKTDRIDANCSICNLITIGKFAVCSINNQNTSTTWHIFGVDTKYIKTNITEVWAGKYAKPYISESSCTTNSFYEGRSRYQFYFGNLVNEKALPGKNHKFALRYKSLGSANGRPVNFIDTGLLLVTYLFPSGSNQYVNLYGYSKSNFDANSLFYQSIGPFSKNLSFPQIEYEPVVNNITQSYLTVIFNDQNTTIPITYFYRYYALSVSPYYRKQAASFINVKVSNVAYLKNFQVTNEYFAAVKTTIQNNAVGLLSFVGNTPDLHYSYSFEVDSFTACSLTTPDNQLLYFRQDTAGLVVMKAGFRLKNQLVLDSIVTLNQYAGMTVKCAHDGLLLHNFNTGKIIVLDSDLIVKKAITVSFTEMKFTRSLALLKNGQYVEIRTLSSGDLLGVNKWDLDNVVTNIHSYGFIYVGQPATYYQYGTNINMTPVDYTFMDAHRSHLQEQ